MAWTPSILIGNSNTYHVDDFRDALSGDLETGVELYASLCLAPTTPLGQAITNATNATPIVITSAAHGLQTGDVVTIVNVGGNGAAKGTWTITRVDANSFSLDTSVGDGDYTGGGQWFECLEGAAGLEMTDEGDGLYSVEIDGSLGLTPNQTYVLIYYCLGAYRDIYNHVARVVARVRGSNA